MLHNTILKKLASDKHFSFLGPFEENKCFECDTRGLNYKNMTIVNDATSWSITLVINYAPRVINYAPRVINYAPRVINYAPRVINYAPNLTYNHHLRSSFTIVKTFIVQATDIQEILGSIRCY